MTSGAQVANLPLQWQGGFELLGGGGHHAGEQT